jgi:predicted restriction endonuclease
MIRDKTEFIAYIDDLPVANTTKHTYRNWVRRIDENLPREISSETVNCEADVRKLADLMPKDLFTPEHIKDVRCIIRYYLKFTISHGVSEQQILADRKKLYSPSDAIEGRERVLRSIALRRGQKQFRERLLVIYQKQCCVTGTNVEDALEAAHIRPYSKDGTNSVTNGLLLRSDIHVLFDLFLISIEPQNIVIYCDSAIRVVPPYSTLHGKRASFPSNALHLPDKAALTEHYEKTKGGSTSR